MVLIRLLDKKEDKNNEHRFDYNIPYGDRNHVFQTTVQKIGNKNITCSISEIAEIQEDIIAESFDVQNNDRDNAKYWNN